MTKKLHLQKKIAAIQEQVVNNLQPSGEKKGDTRK
jgi:hypothetical protein